MPSLLVFLLQLGADRLGIIIPILQMQILTQRDNWVVWTVKYILRLTEDWILSLIINHSFSSLFKIWIRNNLPSMCTCFCMRRVETWKTEERGHLGLKTHLKTIWLLSCYTQKLLVFRICPETHNHKTVLPFVTYNCTKVFGQSPTQGSPFYCPR